VAEPGDLGATRAGYDAIAEGYAKLFRAELADAPLDRALLAAFAEIVHREHGDAEVLEVGSGPGTVAAHLDHLGLAVRGIDLSPAMVGLARRAHPTITFEVGEMGDLDVPGAALAGVVAWYSLIHVPQPRRAAVLREFRRALRPSGHVLLAFQVGDDTLHLEQAFGHEIALDFHRLRADDVVALLHGAGFEVTARLEKAPEGGTAATRVPQGFVMARKPGPGDGHGPPA
jgi:SAM-dependent methyltransferase